MFDTSYNKVIFFFDLDETLLDVRLKDGHPSRLSQSAEIELSNESSDPDGVLTDCLIQGNYRAFEVKAFAREKFKGIFKRIEKINDTDTKVFISILTNASYSYNHILGYLEKFYNTSFNLLSYTNSHGCNLGDGKIYKRELEKGAQMEKEFKFVREQEGFKRNDIYLIDDSFYNCMSASSYGFQTINIPSSHLTREKGLSYSQEEENVFKNLNRILDNIETKSIN